MFRCIMIKLLQAIIANKICHHAVTYSVRMQNSQIILDCSVIQTDFNTERARAWINGCLQAPYFLNENQMQLV